MGYEHEVIRRSNFNRVAELPEILRARGIRGCLIGPVLQADPLDELDWHGIAVLRFGAGLFDQAMDSVAHDFGQCIQDATQRCWERGYRRVGAMLVRHDPPAPDDLEQKAAYEREAFWMRDRMEFVPIFWAKPFDEDLPNFEAWVKRHRPDVILVFNTLAYWMCRRIGLQVPEDIAVITLRRFVEPDTESEPITGFLHEFHRLADIAMERLEERIGAGVFGLPRARGAAIERWRVGLHWVEGTTLPMRG